jgi:dynein heavy chain 2
VLQLKLKALIMDVIHMVEVCLSSPFHTHSMHLQVVDYLMETAILSIQDWAWQKQLRYYASHEETVMRMCDAQFNYTFEYQGNAPKLVHTPLTDKCYLTLTQVWC